MATAVKQITTTGLILPRNGNTVLKSFSIVAAAATSTIAIYDGIRGLTDAVTLGDGVGEDGENYEVDDEVTVASPTPGGTDLILRILTVDTGGEVLTFEVVQQGTGFAAIESQATTGGTGTGFEVDITVDNGGATQVAGASVVANTSDSQNPCVLCKEGISVVVTGTNAVGYIYYE